MSAYAPLLEAYLQGPEQLRQSVTGMSDQQIRARPVPGKWSTLDVICHIADFEGVYAERIKRILAEQNPPLAAGDPDQFLAGLAYDKRVVAEELAAIEAIRRQTARILSTLSDEQFERTGRHSVDGELTIGELLRRITNHVPHHVAFINEKRKALGLDA